VSSRRRVYLDLKKSFLELFKGQARWMKERYGKESIFEKPYLDQDYRQMHLNIPAPDWGKRRRGAEPGFFPSWIGRSYFFDPAKCSFSISGSSTCGDITTFTASMNLIPPSEDATFLWSAKSSHVEVRIVSVVPDSFTTSAEITLVSDEDFDGTAIISVTAELSGSYRKFLRVAVPEYLDSGFAFDVRYENAVNLPHLQSESYVGLVHDCGTEELVVDCDSCKDCLTETPVITYTTQSMQVDETQDLGISGYGSIPASCFTWVVSSGGGSLSVLEGYTTTYTAPASNAECNNNPVISLSCDGTVVDTLAIAVNANTGAATAWNTVSACIPEKENGSQICATDHWPSHVEPACAYVKQYRCDGTLVASCPEFDSAGWAVGASSYVFTYGGCAYSGGRGEAVTCDAIAAVLAAFGAFSSTNDKRTAAMITAGCCPEALL